MGSSLAPFPFDVSQSDILIIISMGALIIHLIVSYNRAADYVKNVDSYMSKLQWNLAVLTHTINCISRMIYIATVATEGVAHTGEAKDWVDKMSKMEGSCLRIVTEYNNNSSRGIRGTIKRWRISKQAKAAAAEAGDLLGTISKIRVLDMLRWETECLVIAKQQLRVDAA